MSTRSYGRKFLAERGYFDREGRDTASLDEGPVEFRYDPDARLAYFEDVGPYRQQDVVGQLRFLGHDFDYYWFWNPSTERVAVYDRYGEHKWFIYDQSLDHAANVRDSKRAKLAAIDEGVGALFDIRDVVDRFYRNLWDIRLDIARSFTVPGSATITDEERLLAAQRTIDRLIFCYFLIEKDIIHGVDGAGNRLELDPKETFDSLLQTDDFRDFLSATSFDHLNTTGWTEHEVDESFSITFPYLNGGLFRNHPIPTEEGGEVRERRLDVSDYEWRALVGELNSYNWLIEEPPEERNEGPKKLSPAVLGHIFEKFVITVGELADEESLSLAELDELNISESGEQLLRGNKKVGAYYTPNYIAYENTRETLWNRVREKLASGAGVDPGRIPDADEFFERVRGEADLPVDLDDLDAVLSSLSVIDPSAGSGAFLMTAGEILVQWRRKCNPDATHYDLRRDVVRESLYGVDLLEGAVEVCKLRLWLWLISAGAVDLSGGEPEVETLPNVDFNIRQGNSLVGVAAAEYDSTLFSHLEFEWIDGEHTTYPEAVRAYHRDIEKYQPAAGERAEELRERLRTQRGILQEELDRIYAEEREVTVEEEVASPDAFEEAMAGVTGPVKLNLDFGSPMTDAEREQVADAGFREQTNWPTTAYHEDGRKADPAEVEAVFELMEDRGSVTIERPITADDVSALNPFHWIFEFPRVYSVPEDRGFDVVIGNPPHGSELDDLQTSVLEDSYDLVEGGREAAKMFTERSWDLADGELSYIVPKPSTYNSNWEDFRDFCGDKVLRGVDLGKAFRNVDHEQVTIHLSRGTLADEYTCGRLVEGSYHLDESATVDRSLAAKLGTLPVSFSTAEQEVAAGLSGAGYPTLGDLDLDAGRGASTTRRTDDTGTPIAYNGKQVQRYFTRAAEDSIEADGISDAVRRRIETPKVMAQNIIAHKRNPYDHVVIASLFDSEGVYDFETVTNIVLPEESELTHPALAVLLNTQFVNWFVYFSIFNRAIRDMHLDAYFLEHLVIPKNLSAEELTVLDRLYGLLAVTGTAAEYEALPAAGETYGTLQSVANALTYELYLRDAPTEPLETDLAGVLAAPLEESEVDYGDWYGEHLTCNGVEAVVDAFDRDLLTAAETAADAVRSEAVDSELAAIAEHPWVKIIERGQHVTEGAPRPIFGPGRTPR